MEYVPYSSYLSKINDRFMLLPFLEQTPNFPLRRFVKGTLLHLRAALHLTINSIVKEVPLVPNCRTIPSKFNPTSIALTGSLIASRIEQSHKQAKKRIHSKK